MFWKKLHGELVLLDILDSWSVFESDCGRDQGYEKYGEKDALDELASSKVEGKERRRCF